MAAFFKTEFAADGVRVRALDKRSFGRVREIPRLNWSTAGLDRESLLELESLVESGAAKSTDLEVWISSDEAASLPDRVCETVGRDFEQRVSAWFPVQNTLKNLTGAEVHRDGFLETFTLYQAAAFALDV